ncbi:helix-turn-helix domain-containing protein [Falsiruegeria mediterranea]|nr:helix-turn-helix domain-containing protein [Falsiruegeria mediterranea]
MEAYGFDLSPLSARAAEVEQLQAVLQGERELCMRLKCQITVARRMIHARIEAALSGSWTYLAELFEDLLKRLPRRNTTSETLSKLLAGFKELQDRVEATYFEAQGTDEVVDNPAEIKEQVPSKTQEMDPTEVIPEPHILTTNQLNPVICIRSIDEHRADAAPKSQTKDPADSELEEWVEETRKKRETALDLPSVMQAFPETASWARNMGGYLKDWSDLHRVAGKLGPMIGVLSMP